MNVQQKQKLPSPATGRDRGPARWMRGATQATRTRGFSLMEVLIAMGVTGIMVTALYAGLAWCVSSVRIARENLRATAVMVEKMEVIRLLTWDQITSNNIIPKTFMAAYTTSGSVDSKNNTNAYNGGFNYYGNVTIVPPLDTQLQGNYTNDLRVIHVKVYWTNQGMPHSRSINSYVSRYGIQNYAIN
jgi:prepilin-type N-terminal cleavage/methylation domain-containing protein